MNKEKVRELAAKLFTECGLHIPKGESVIKEWLEQNPIEPVVVGLSDEQIEQLAHETFQFVEEFFCENEDIPVAGDYTHHLKSWLKHEDFAQPEVKEVVVGLSDEQVNAFACYYGLSTTEQSKLRCELKKWQKTQTFAQPEPVVVGSSDEA